MYEMFSLSKEYKLPDGLTSTGRELLESGNYPGLDETYSVMDLYDGVLRSITSIDALRQNCGIDETNPVIVLSKAENQRKMTIRAHNTQKMMLTAAAKVAQIAAQSFTDAQALEVSEIYPDFEIGKSYKKNEYFNYDGVLYKVNQDHTSQEQWIPGQSGTESLYTKVVLNESGYKVWQQPTGAHDAYNTGDIVEYKGVLYKSLIDGNAYSPEAYPAGWEKYIEPEE